MVREWHEQESHAGSPRGIAPPGLPQIRTCGFPASGSSGQSFAAWGERGVDDAGRTRIYDLRIVIEECQSLLRRHPSVSQCELTDDLAPVAPIAGHPMLIWNAVSNLILNAAEATQG